MSAPPVGMQSAARAHVIVIGNEKSGAGKSTLAMHLAVALLRSGASVGVIDLDLRQRTLSRYIENRRALQPTLPMPRTVSLGLLASSDDFHASLSDLAKMCAYVVIDTPGADTPFSRAAHASADTLITPLNDSVNDCGGLGAARAGEALTPSLYSEMVWESRKQKLQARGGPIDWIVMRNRLSPGRREAKHKRAGEALAALSGRIGFRLTAGLNERAVFTELFSQGLTVLDVGSGLHASGLKMAHLAARQELRELLSMLKLPGAPAAIAA